MKTRLALPCLLGSLLLSSAVHAASALVPPKGYYAAVEIRKGEAQACQAVPEPYTGELVFRSKYEGSDSARSTLNKKAEKAFRTKTNRLPEPLRSEVKAFPRQALHARLLEFRHPATHLTMTFEAPIIDGDRAAHPYSSRATHVGDFMGMPGTGRKFQIEGALIYKFDDGLIAEERRIYDFTGLLMQLGVLKGRPAGRGSE